MVTCICAVKNRLVLLSIPAIIKLLYGLRYEPHAGGSHHSTALSSLTSPALYNISSHSKTISGLDISSNAAAHSHATVLYTINTLSLSILAPVNFCVGSMPKANPIALDVILSQLPLSRLYLNVVAYNCVLHPPLSYVHNCIAVTESITTCSTFSDWLAVRCHAELLTISYIGTTSQLLFIATGLICAGSLLKS